jgi:hypothetical protein
MGKLAFSTGCGSTRWQLLLFLGAAFVAASCGARESSGGPGGSTGPGTGQIAFALTVPNGIELDTVSYQLLNANGGSVQSGSISVQSSQSVEFQLSNVLPGTGYTVTTTSTGTAGVNCSGSAGPFTVRARGTTTVQIGMACYAPGSDGGNVFVTGTPYLCGTWNSLSTVGADDQITNGSEANVGSSITLTATATGPDPKGLTYTWTSSNPIGTFGANQPNGTSDTITFACTAPGTTTITLVVGDGPVPQGFSCSAVQSTITATVTCDEPPAAFDRVSFTITTGATALNVADTGEVTLVPNSGTPQTFTVKAVGDPAWKAHTTHTASFTLKPTLGTCDVASAVVTFVPGNADPAVAAPGSWEVTALAATLSIDGADQTTIVQAKGTPLAELTGAQTSFQTPASCNTGPSLFDRLGGEAAIIVVANDFVGRVAADPALSQIVSNVLSTPAATTAADQWMAAEMCRLAGGGCALPGPAPFGGVATTTAEAIALVQDLTVAVAGFPAPAALADENQLLGVPLVIDQNPLPPPLLPNGQPDPTAAVGGGISQPQYFNIYWDSTWDADNTATTRQAVDSLMQAITGSTYFFGLAEYGVVNQAFLGSALPSSACTQHSPSSVGFYDPVNPSIIGFLNCELSNDSAVPQGDNVIYNVILPKGSREVDAIPNFLGLPQDCTPGGAVSWHFHGTPYSVGEFIGGLLGGALGLETGDPVLGALAGFFVGLATQNGPFYTISSVDPGCDVYTDNLLHEVIEAASDPEPGLSVLLSGGSGEVADMCEPPVTSDFPPLPSWEPGVGSFAMPVQVPQYFSNLHQTCTTGFGDSSVPAIAEADISGTFPALSISITGSNFGTLPASFLLPYGADLPYIGVRDLTQKWQAGNSLNSDAMPMTVTSWSDTAITISSFSPPNGSSMVANGNDALAIWVCNPASGNCGAIDTSIPASAGDGGLVNQSDIESITVTFGTGNDNARQDDELQLTVEGQSTVCLKPSNNASSDSVCANGGSATDQTGHNSWENNTTDGPQTFNLSTNTTVLSEMTVTLISHNNGTEGDDNWDIQSVLVIANLIDGSSTTLLNIPSAGSPNDDNCIARLKGQPNASAVTFALNGSGTHIYANGKELGESTTCKNNGDQ